jgi:hypothetical protein
VLVPLEGANRRLGDQSVSNVHFRRPQLLWAVSEHAPRAVGASARVRVTSAQLRAEAVGEDGMGSVLLLVELPFRLRCGRRPACWLGTEVLIDISAVACKLRRRLLTFASGAAGPRGMAGR